MKRHLLKAGGNPARSACGLRAPPLMTTNPEQVTCAACQRTFYMADAEFRRDTKRTPRRSRRTEQP